MMTDHGDFHAAYFSFICSKWQRWIFLQGALNRVDVSHHPIMNSNKKKLGQLRSLA